MNIRLGYRLLRDHRVPIRAKLIALGIGAACIGVLELLQLPLEALLAGILPLIGVSGDIVFDGAEAIVGPVIIATMLLPYLVAPPLVQQIRAEGEGVRGFYARLFFGGRPAWLSICSLKSGRGGGGERWNSACRRRHRQTLCFLLLRRLDECLNLVASAPSFRTVQIANGEHHF